MQENIFGVLRVSLNPHNVLSISEHLDSGLVRPSNYLCPWRQFPHLQQIQNLQACCYSSTIHYCIKSRIDKEQLHVLGYRPRRDDIQWQGGERGSEGRRANCWSPKGECRWLLCPNLWWLSLFCLPRPCSVSGTKNQHKTLEHYQGRIKPLRLESKRTSRINIKIRLLLF